MKLYEVLDNINKILQQEPEALNWELETCLDAKSQTNIRFDPRMAFCIPVKGYVTKKVVLMFLTSEEGRMNDR